jgi:hypothetical protein
MPANTNNAVWLGVGICALIILLYIIFKHVS